MIMDDIDEANNDRPTTTNCKKERLSQEAFMKGQVMRPLFRSCQPPNSLHQEEGARQESSLSKMTSGTNLALNCILLSSPQIIPLTSSTRDEADDSSSDEESLYSADRSSNCSNDDDEEEADPVLDDKRKKKVLEIFRRDLLKDDLSLFHEQLSKFQQQRDKQ